MAVIVVLLEKTVYGNLGSDSFTRQHKAINWSDAWLKAIDKWFAIQEYNFYWLVEVAVIVVLDKNCLWKLGKWQLY